MAKKKKTNRASTLSLGMPAPAGGAIASMSSNGLNTKGNGGKSLAPVAVSRNITMKAPKLSNVASGTIRVTHREYFSDVTNSGNFLPVGFAINPGLSMIFPWLSRIAPQYEMYKFQKLAFCFRSYVATSSKGVVMFAVDYDASDQPPVEKTQLMSYKGAQRCNVWSEANLNCVGDLKHFAAERFVRTGDIPANSDVKTYDIGSLFVGTQNGTDNEAVGELYVDYVVDLITPQLDPSLAATSNSLRLINGDNETPALPFGEIATQVKTGGLPLIFTPNTVSSRIVGDYIFAFKITGTGIGATNPTITNPAGGGTTQFTSLGWVAGAGGLSGEYMLLVRFRDRDVSKTTLIFNFTPSAVTITGLDLRVASYSYALG